MCALYISVSVMKPSSRMCQLSRETSGQMNEHPRAGFEVEKGETIGRSEVMFSNGSAAFQRR